MKLAVKVNRWRGKLLNIGTAMLNRRWKETCLTAAALACLVLFPGGSAAAQGVSRAEAERKAVEVFDTTMSPFCPGRTLSACPSEMARGLRDEIIEQFLSGASIADVRQELLANYGNGVSGVPQGGRYSILGILAPVAFVLVGLAVLVVYLRKQRQPELLRNQPAAQDEFELQVEAELKRRLSAKNTP